MQSIFRLPWCSEQIAPKMSEKASLDQMRATPVVEIPAMNKLKRKRTNSSELLSPPRAQQNKKQRSETTQALPSSNARLLVKTEPEQTFTHASGPVGRVAAVAEASTVESVQPAGSSANSSLPTNSTNIAQENRPSGFMAEPQDVHMLGAQQSIFNDVAGLSSLQQVIENEFNMQILMKHNELRLIEQELSKCQIALEQLRRCELRPFPGSSQPSEAVSAGLGASIAPPPGYTRPSHPAPCGVIDGPYSRHYRQWLLHDTQFDAVAMQSPTYMDGGANSAARSTRNSGSARKSISKPFTYLGRQTDPLQSLPNYPPVAAKDKSAPLVLRRSTDDQLVKLICNNCLRGNFSSIQGFLNHCRIAHKVDYKSHDAAAVDCGRLLDENEAANLPPETHNTPAPKPSTSRASTAVSTSSRNVVHPFNTTAGASMIFSATQQATPNRLVPVASLNTAAPSISGPPFTPSPNFPRLSAQFAKNQLGGDLAKAAASAKQKVDLGPDDDLLSPDWEQSSPLEPMAGARTVAGSARSGMLATTGNVPRPPSRKGYRQPMQRPRPSPLAPALANGALQQQHSEIPESPQDQALNLSPHTANSNPPGLVSDHEDDDHGSASEEEAPQAEMRRPLPVGRNCSDKMEIDVAVDDDMNQHGVVIRRNSMFAEDDRGLRAAGSPSRKLGMGKRSR